MSDLKIYDDYNTLPEQVQINKEDITKLKEDIGKIKPNAWEERKFKIGEDDMTIDCITYNPITDTNTPVNIQKAFTDKDTYSTTDAINSYSFVASMNMEGTNAILYVICADPTIPLGDIFDNSHSTKDAIVFLSSESGGTLNITCSELKATGGVKTKSLSIGGVNGDDESHEITKISNDDADTASSTLLSAFAISQYYLKKTDASNTYLTKTDASNTYVTIQDYEERIDTGNISLTQAGYDKINAMGENIGTTITLTATSDFTENTQVSNTRELILSVNYNGNPIYRNIHLMPNQTIDDYTAYQEDTEENWYTGHAMLVLPSQDYGYFAISYQNGTRSQLILTLIAHY